MDERMSESAAEVIAAHASMYDRFRQCDVCVCDRWADADYHDGSKTHAEHVLDALREAGWKLIHPESMTRVDIIGPGVKEFWADEWDALIQDDGATLKLFQVGDGAEAKAERNSHLVAEINANIAALAERASARESQDGESDA